MAEKRKSNRYRAAPWRMRRVSWWVWVIGLAQMWSPWSAFCKDEAAPPEVIVSVKETANVEGAVVRLKDISLIDADESLLAERIGKIEICEAPKPGFEKRLTGRWIESMIPTGGGENAEISFKAPATIIVRRAAQTIPEEKLLGVFQSFLEGLHANSEVIVSHFKVRGGNIFPLGAIDVMPVPDNRKRMGLQTLSVKVTVDGKDEGTLLLSGKADIYQKVVCASKYIERGTTLSSEDVCLKSMNISKAPPDVLRHMEDASGRLATVTLREGAFLRERTLTTPPVIEKGDKVKLVAQKGALSVVTMGVAKTEGAAGAQIQVKNLSSGKVVSGLVKDASTVEVVF